MTVSNDAGLIDLSRRYCSVIKVSWLEPAPDKPFAVSEAALVNGFGHHPYMHTNERAVLLNWGESPLVSNLYHIESLVRFLHTYLFYVLCFHTFFFGGAALMGRGI